MPPKINTRTKTPDGSAPTTPVETNAPEVSRLSTGKTPSAATVSGITTGKKPKGKEKKSGEKVLCKGTDEKPCGKPVQDNEMGGIECEVCLAWFHPGCQGVDDEAYEVIQRKGLFWLCNICKKQISGFRTLIQGKTGCETENDKFSRMEKKIDEISKALLENTAAMKAEIAKVETKQKTYSEAVSSQGAVSEPKFSQNSFQECFENFHSEKEEQSKRKCNLAVVNMPESTSTESAERIKEDIDLLTDIIKQELHLNVRIEKAIRVGKKKDDQPRVMIVTLKDEETKWEVLKASKALRESENEITKNMYINRDMTRQERERNRLLREELKARRANGENVKIVKGKCVVLKKAAQSEMRRTQEDAERTHSGASSQV